MREVCNYLRNFRLFEHFESPVKEKLWKHMTNKEFIRGQSVYKRGKSATDGLYFVVEGDFEVTTQQDVDKSVNNTLKSS